MKYIILIIFSFYLKLYAAAGDIVSATMADNGWEMTVRFSGLATNGTFDFKLQTNIFTYSGITIVYLTPTVNTPKITLNSCGYNDDGTTNITSIQFWAAKQLRFTTPSEAFNNTTNISGDTYVKIATTDYVFLKDTSVVIDFPSGFYTSAGTPNTASSGLSLDVTAVTNTYPKVIGNWTWPSYERAETTLTNRAIAFHRSAQDGRSVRVIRFTTTDGTTTVTNFITRAEIDRSFGDAVPIIEFIDRCSTTSFIQGAQLTRNFIAYPFVGDSGSILDTTATGASQPTPLPAPIFAVCDKTGAYGQTVAVVSSGGNDGTGAVTSLGSFDPGSPPAAYLTINKAADAIEIYNAANHSRANCGAGIIYLRYDGGTGHNWTGAANAISVTPRPYTALIITTFPNDTQATIVTNVSNKHLGATTPILFRNINLTLGVNSGSMSGFEFAHVDQCTVNNTGGTSDLTFFQINTWNITRSTVTALRQANKGLSFFSATYNLALLRGNNVASTLGGGIWYNYLGNIFTGGTLSLNSYSLTISPVNAYPIFAFNRIRNHTSASLPAVKALNDLSHEAHGAAIIQNEVEVGNNTQATFQIAADASTNTPANNVLFWNNSDSGAKLNAGYADAGSTLIVRQFWSWLNNVQEDFNIKSDTFPTANAARVGNWSFVYGVGSYGNIDAAAGFIGAPTDFQQAFSGLSSYQTSTGDYPVSGATNLQSYLQFVDRKSYTGVAGAGSGNYRVQSKSPTVLVKTKWVLPFDIEGNSRGEMDPPGAYASAVPRKGGMFFGSQ